MMHKTLGLDIGRRAVRYALCLIDGRKVKIEKYGKVEFAPLPVSMPLPDESSSKDALRKSGVFAVSPLNNALNEVSQQIYDSKVTIDSICTTLDPTLALSAHRLLPFNEPRAVEQILPLSVGDIWSCDDSSQISFEIGEYTQEKSSKDNKAEGGTEDTPSGGYDVHAILYPKAAIIEQISRLKEYRLDPHAALPANEVLPFALNRALTSQSGCWCLLDIGEDRTTLSICEDDTVKETRSLKLGGANFDEIIGQDFGISAEEAKTMKEQTGFIAMPGTETAAYTQWIAEGRIVPWDINPVKLSNACTRGIQMILPSIVQTITGYINKNHHEPTCIYLTGGAAALAGLDVWLSQFCGVTCTRALPWNLNDAKMHENPDDCSLDAVGAACAAYANLDSKCPLNLRRGELAHKGSMAILQDYKFLWAALVLAMIAAATFMTVSKANAVKAEHEQVKLALEKATQEVFGKKMLSLSQIQNAVKQSKGYSFIPEKTAFSHFEWMSNQINDNLADVEMDLTSIDIDNQRKIITLRGEVTGEDGLTKFLQLMEQYECFPNEIPVPRTSKVKDRITFSTLRIEASHCGGETDNE